MPNNNQEQRPGEEHYYNQGQQGGSQLPKRPRAMTIVVIVLSALVIILGATLFLVLRSMSTTTLATIPQPSSTNQALTPAATSSTGGTLATSISATAQPIATVATAQPIVTVASGTITENLQLTCGANCNDPIQMTITTIQVDDANGRMIWNISLKNVTGSSVGYGITTFELLANGAQTQIPANFTQQSGTILNSDPYNIQGIFTFVPIQNTTYTLTAAVRENPFVGPTITFDPTQITNL